MSRRMNDLTPEVSAMHSLGAELRRPRIMSGLSQAELGAEIAYSASMVAKVEKAERWPSLHFVQQSDNALGADTALIELWEEARREKECSQAEPFVPVGSALADRYPQPAQSGELIARLAESWKDLSALVSGLDHRYRIIASIEDALAAQAAYPRSGLSPSPDRPAGIGFRRPGGDHSRISG
ncbi:helix-turn-helix domain-containing protein [Nocardia zapadnayensis]|uniref:helix-turn-helix domain-containing protein n=1 Tax=Nocardia rhamnosiphila TaxID=426716 RepID=UPI0022452DF8|nr:helix-turn-helix transcriptional regulator [Nocardia zapadnayensis]MCX0269570.1 helix-turn-helix domain-containing protein [Nocardia zapadnayensis]